MQQPLTFTELKEFTQRLNNLTHFLNRARVSTENTLIIAFISFLQCCNTKTHDIRSKSKTSGNKKKTVLFTDVLGTGEKYLAKAPAWKRKQNIRNLGIEKEFFVRKSISQKLSLSS